MTKWAKDVSPDNVHPDYPRPQLVREQWHNLNGLWDYAIRPREESQPQGHDGKILVPFPVESALSGVMKSVGPESRLWYRRTFELPQSWVGKRVLLHFGAVDWDATVLINGRLVGKHQGGYDPFTLDITDDLKAGGSQELTVAVVDPSDAGMQPRGKQIRNPHGIWYTPTTGIWQTVWLEPVNSAAYIRSLRIIPNASSRKTVVLLDVAATPGTSFGWNATTKTQGIKVSVDRTETNQPRITFEGGELWTPEAPHLYEFQVGLIRPMGFDYVDSVTSYFALRNVNLARDDQDVQRVMLNDKPVFQYGPLDQGFWPDGLYTAPTDEALRYDIEVTKQLGFNMIRKHVKVEPARWYYWCDKLGMLVWQDMPSGDKYIRPQDPDITRTPQSASQFETEWKRIIDALRNHPSIVMWVPFNEGWGQFDTARIAEITKQYDPTRLVNSASGWTDRGVGDVHDIHVYPGPGIPKAEAKRALVLGEYGGLGLPLKGHTWQDEKNWGYRSFKTEDELTAAYLGLVAKLRPMIGQGLSAAVYTQTTDVEIEVNGLLTYDRAVLKMPLEKIAAANRKLYGPPPKVVTVVPTSQETGIEWRYTTEKPADGWEQPAFADTVWRSAPGGFGEKTTPGSVVRTAWKTPDIWLRRAIEIPGTKLADPHFLIHHDEETEISIDGVLAAKTSGYVTSYLPVPVQDAARKLLTPGKHTIAVHCHQTGGGQYIDVGIIDLVE